MRLAPSPTALPSPLRARLALVVLLGVFLIPVGMSSLRGLTHVLTCQEKASIPFTIIRPETGNATILSSTTVERGDEEGVCGGLVLELAVGNERPGRVELVVPLRNTTEEDWRGTVQLQVGRTAIPISIGEVKAGETESDVLTLRVPEGRTELSGSVLIGP